MEAAEDADGIVFFDLVSSPDAAADCSDSTQTQSKAVSRQVGRESRRPKKDEDKRAAKRGANGRCTNSENKLNTDMFESYLEELWSRISDDNKNSCTYLDSLWFSFYKDALIKADENQKAKVLRWIREKQIFSRKYVFVPIVCWKHWSLLILCHFGEDIGSKTKRPCMLLLDSLVMIDPKRLEPDIRRFIWDIYETESSLVDKACISRIPLLVPKVPQQTNGEECGLFVLYFIYLFLESAPEVFCQESYPYFLTENWFALEDLEKFRKDVYSFSAKNCIQNFSLRGECYLLRLLLSLCYLSRGTFAKIIAYSYPALPMITVGIQHSSYHIFS